MSPNSTAPCKPVDCAEVLMLQEKMQSGVYSVWPRNRVTGDRPLDVYCDMDTVGGGWLVRLLQRNPTFLVKIIIRDLLLQHREQWNLFELSSSGPRLLRSEKCIDSQYSGR